MLQMNRFWKKIFESEPLPSPPSCIQLRHAAEMAGIGAVYIDMCNTAPPEIRQELVELGMARCKPHELVLFTKLVDPLDCRIAALRTPHGQFDVRWLPISRHIVDRFLCALNSDVEFGMGEFMRAVVLLSPLQFEQVCLVSNTFVSVIESLYTRQFECLRDADLLRARAGIARCQIGDTVPRIEMLRSLLQGKFIKGWAKMAASDCFVRRVVVTMMRPCCYPVLLRTHLTLDVDNMLVVLARCTPTQVLPFWRKFEGQCDQVEWLALVRCDFASLQTLGNLVGSRWRHLVHIRQTPSPIDQLHMLYTIDEELLVKSASHWWHVAKLLGDEAQQVYIARFPSHLWANFVVDMKDIQMSSVFVRRLCILRDLLPASMWTQTKLVPSLALELLIKTEINADVWLESCEVTDTDTQKLYILKTGRVPQNIELTCPLVKFILEHCTSVSHLVKVLYEGTHCSESDYIDLLRRHAHDESADICDIFAAIPVHNYEMARIALVLVEPRHVERIWSSIKSRDVAQTWASLALRRQPQEELVKFLAQIRHPSCDDVEYVVVNSHPSMVADLMRTYWCNEDGRDNVLTELGSILCDPRDLPRLARCTDVAIYRCLSNDIPIILSKIARPLKETRLHAMLRYRGNDLDTLVLVWGDKSWFCEQLVLRYNKNERDKQTDE